MLEGCYVGCPGRFDGADEGQHRGRDVSTTVAEFTAPDRSEAQLRVQLAAAYRLVIYFGWNESIYGHLTVRVPGPERHFLIDPYALRYDGVTASNLVKIDSTARSSVQAIDR